MKLKEAVDLGRACGLRTVEECVRNVHIHCMSLFIYEDVPGELNELDKEYQEWLCSFEEY